MTWLVLCHDGANAAALRKRYLDRHLAYIESVMDQVAVAGPLAESADGEFTGSCFIYHTEDRSVAESLLRNDPYFAAGLYRSVTFHAFRAAAGGWVGGPTWR